MNPYSFWHRLRERLNRPKRYQYLYQFIERVHPRTLMEIGVWDGNRAVQMIETAKRFRPASEISYFGFDLFEDLTQEKFQEEYSKMPPPRAAVEERLRATGARIELVQGDTMQTLPNRSGTLPPMDFVFIDGGHSVATIDNDWRHVLPLMHDGTIVLFDDYWDTTDSGAKAVVDAINKEKYDVEVLSIADRLGDGARGRIRFAKVRLR